MSLSNFTDQELKAELEKRLMPPVKQCSSSDLRVLAYANNFTLWHYTTTDSSVITDGYFNRAVDMLRVNDLLIVNTSTGGTPVTKFHIVTGNDGSKVTVTVYS